MPPNEDDLRTRPEPALDELQPTEKKTEKARHRCLELFDQAAMPYLDLGAGMEILEANAAAATLLRQARGELIGKKLPAYLRTGDAERFHAFIQNSLERASSRACELDVQAATGEQVPVRLLCAVADGEIPTLHLGNKSEQVSKMAKCARSRSRPVPGCHALPQVPSAVL
jgi:PAS domain-containing protein